MAVRLITYDLKKEQTKEDYEGFYKYIKSFAWARLSESSYAIQTDLSPQTIFNNLSSFVDENDWVLVMTLTNPYYGQHSKQVIEWMESIL